MMTSTRKFTISLAQMSGNKIRVGLGKSTKRASATGSPRAVIVAGVVGILTGLATLVALQFLSGTT
jgi:hypothetical protein